MGRPNGSIVLLAGLGYGDEGKGSSVDALAQRFNARLVVRYNGGSQAAHGVVAADGRQHVFAQFGSGMFVPGVRSHIARGMLVNPINLMGEGRCLQDLGLGDAFARLTVDREALVTTQFHVAANRLREIARSHGRHGSCGMGIGETMKDHLEFPDRSISIGDLEQLSTLRSKLACVQAAKQAEFAQVVSHIQRTPAVLREWGIIEGSHTIDLCLDYYRYFRQQISIVDRSFLDKILRGSDPVIFEGAQGMLLDEVFGFYPYTTWTNITFGNALNLLRDAGVETQAVTKVGVLRAYATRHGAGPFVTEERLLTQALPDTHNGWGEWQQNFRIGHFDLPVSRYARNVIGGVDQLILTNIDRLMTQPGVKLCVGYEQANPDQALFQVVDGSIVDIRTEPSPSIEHQERLGQALLKVRPIYKSFGRLSDPRHLESYLSVIERELGVPITWCSFGPRADSKVSRHTSV